MRRLATALFIGASFLIIPAIRSAPPKDEAIWGDPVLKQPFDKGEFRQIKIPAWVQETIGCGYTLLGHGQQGAGRGRGARRDDQRDGLRRPVLRLLRQQAPEEAQPARPARTGWRRTSPSTSGWASASWASIRRASKARSTRTIPTGGGSRPTRPRFPRST